MNEQPAQQFPSTVYRGELVDRDLEVAGIRRIDNDHDGIRVVFRGPVSTLKTETTNSAIPILASAILTDAVSHAVGDDTIACAAYGREVVANLNFTGFELKASAVVEWYERYRRRPKGAAS